VRTIVWLDQAVDDLVRLRQFIGTENKAAAQRAAATIRNTIRILEQYPDIVHPVEELPDFHDLVVPFGAGNFVVRYRIHGETVYVVAIRHNREEGFRG
jgi:plasmid stabilization system protein ParE